MNINRIIKIIDGCIRAISVKRKVLLSITITILLLSLVQTSHADWPVFSRPEFRGRIIDADTKQPIEGAVAVVLYDKVMLIGGPGGPNSYVFHARECLTDKKGLFYFPSYFSLHIISSGEGARFIFYKPGFMDSDGPTNVSPFLVEDYFSASEAGKIGEIHVKQGTPASYNGPLGIVVLKKGEGYPSVPYNYRSNKLPLLFKALNEDRRNRGYQGELK